ncbi:hypothetical protein CR513_35035, partial [Mucuna pruriens]
MPHSSTNEMLFCLTFGTEVVIPIEIGESSPRTALFQSGENEEELRANLQDLVLRKITRTVDNNKLTPDWEGPFKVIEEVGKGAYRLEHLDDKKIPQTWNALNL